MDVQDDPALEPAQPALLSSTRRTRDTDAARARAARVEEGGGGEERGTTGEQAGTAAGVLTNAREGGARTDGDERRGATATATVPGSEDGVLDALLDLPAGVPGTGAGGGSSRAGEQGLATLGAGLAALNASLSPTPLSPSHNDGQGEDGVPAEPAGAAPKCDRGGGATEAVGAGGFGTNAGVGGAISGGGGGDDADELEDWLDDMLADA